jgi:hypothetical protein
LEVICLIEVRRVGAVREINTFGVKHRKYTNVHGNLHYISQFDKIPKLLDKIEEDFKIMNENINNQCTTTS